MCIAESSIVSIVSSVLVVIGSLISTYLVLRNRSLEKYKMKQEAILKALNFLDTYCSYLNFPNKPTPERDTSYDSTKMTLEARECYAQLCVSVNNKKILDEFLNIVMGYNNYVFRSLYIFRNLSRKELGLHKISFDNDSIFLSTVSSKDLRSNDNIKERKKL